ncbi:MAG TPA: hypothetical protein VGR26_12385, partial [Acidimicrobiales bacterium]|nr:hypothetical protein [Acidimicrobiales bacterium]
RKERLCGSSISHGLAASYRAYDRSSVLRRQITERGKGTPCDRKDNEAGKKHARDDSTDRPEEE